MTLRNTITAIALGAALSAPASAPAPSRPFGDEYVLAWAEEFNADSLDRSIWNVEVNGSGCGNNELQYYIDSPGNISLADGNLVITARRENCDGHAFTSGRLNTLGKFQFTYGLVEARVKLPSTSDGLWPAVWFLGADYHTNAWPRCGEIDLLEMGHADGIATATQDRLFNGAVHYGTGSHHQQVGPFTMPASLQDGEYHSFFLRWTPQAIEMFVDDVAEPYLCIDITDHTPEQPGYYFHKPQFLILNLAVGGDFPGIHDPGKVTALSGDGSSASMAIDYIRVFTPQNQYLTQK